MARRGGGLSIFAVDDRSAQVFWRGLPAGPLRVEVLDGRRIVAQQTVEVDAGLPGGSVLTGLPAGTSLELIAHHRGSEIHRSSIRTDDPLPGEELCRIATISDLHLGARSFGHRGTIVEPPHPNGPHPQRCTRAAIGDLVDWGAERLIAKGDITNGASLPQWRTWSQLIDEAPIPVDSLPGNHDRDHPDSDTPIDIADAAALFGFRIADPLLVRDLPGLRVVLVDTCIPGSNRGTLARVGDDVVDIAADTDREAMVAVLLHHQLEPITGPEGWPIGVPHRESRAFLARLARAHHRSFVSSGHTHRHRRWSHTGVTTTQVGSVKDFPGVWAGYRVSEGGFAQLVRRVQDPDCLVWTDHTRRAAAGMWRFIAPGTHAARTFSQHWDR